MIRFTMLIGFVTTLALFGCGRRSVNTVTQPSALEPDVTVPTPIPPVEPTTVPTGYEARRFASGRIVAKISETEYCDYADETHYRNESVVPGVLLPAITELPPGSRSIGICPIAAGTYINGQGQVRFTNGVIQRDANGGIYTDACVFLGAEHLFLVRGTTDLLGVRSFNGVEIASVRVRGACAVPAGKLFSVGGTVYLTTAPATACRFASWSDYVLRTGKNNVEGVRSVPSLPSINVQSTELCTRDGSAPRL